MSNQIVNALREAKVELPPLKRRVWNYLKEHPNCCYNTIAAGLNAPKSHVASALQVVARNNLVYITEQPKRIFANNGVIRVRQVKYYRARGESYNTYLPAEVKIEPYPPQVAEPTVELRKDTGSSVPEFDFRKFVTQLSPYQAREFYNALKEIFE